MFSNNAPSVHVFALLPLPCSKSFNEVIWLHNIIVMLLFKKKWFRRMAQWKMVNATKDMINFYFIDHFSSIKVEVSLLK
jgi:hypothetical protein